MDFGTGLPEWEKFGARCVAVDKLLKMKNFIPCRTTIDSDGLTVVFLNGVARLHGLRGMIISDQRHQFATVFLKRLFEWLGVQRLLPTAFHPKQMARWKNLMLEWNCTFEYSQATSRMIRYVATYSGVCSK
jgi:hypothetical protein